MSCDEAERIAGETQAELDIIHGSLPVRPKIHLVHRANGKGCGKYVGDVQTDVPDLEIGSEGTGSEYRFELRQGEVKASFKYEKSQSLAKNLASSINDVFVGETIAHLLNIDGLVTDHAFKDGLGRYSAEAVHKIESQIGRAAKTSPDYHITFSLFSASGAPSSWDIQGALKIHIEPLIRALRKAANVEIGTQVQLFSPYSPSIQSSQIDGTRGNFLRHNDLTSFVNAAEWPLSPSVGDGPTMNFIVYVPSKADTPLGIDGNLGGAWLVPQWGAVNILNTEFVQDPETNVLNLPPHLSADDLSEAFSTFSTQLLTLLGVPAMEFHGKPAPLPLRLQAHQRVSALSLHLKAASSLASLARLAKHMNTIPIPRHVSQLVDNSLSNLTASHTALSAGHWSEAVQFASSAYKDSEKAFFDKSMVGQVYFPDEHKVAVYLPLLGPTGLPLVVSLLKEVKQFIAAVKGRKPA